LVGATAIVVVVLIATKGYQPAAQATANGLVSGTYFALGAVGLALVFGVLRLVNFAHGDFLTFGAYSALLANAFFNLPIIVATAIAVAATAVLAAILELAVWRPMRARRAGGLQLLLIAIGLAFVIRNGIQIAAGTEPRTLHVDITSAVSFLGGIRLAGIDTGRVIIATWLVAGALAGLAGVLVAAAVGVLTPQFGFQLLLSLFAATILGGIGNAYGALAGGLLLGLAQEWSTLFIDPRWKLAVGFAILILTLLIRPNGLLGRPALK